MERVTSSNLNFSQTLLEKEIEQSVLIKIPIFVNI